MKVPKVIKNDPKAKLEKDVEARFRLRIAKAGGTSWKFVSPSNRGVSDRIVLFYGRTIYVEMKRTGGKMTPKQELFRQKVLDNGGEFACVEGDAGTDAFIKELNANVHWYSQFLIVCRAIVKRIIGHYK